MSEINSKLAPTAKRPTDGRDSSHAHVYPMKKYWQYTNQILGFWSWFCVFASIVGSLFLLLVFEWARKVLPAFCKMIAGEPRGYLRISENGLEYRNWPFWEMRCKWENVKGIQKGRWLGDVLYLQHAEEIGFLEFSIKPSQQQIHLSSLSGWPDGGLEDDLRRYVPRLFE
jgi:hypothetical protein